MTIVASVLVAAVEMMMTTMTTGTNGMIATMTITMMMMTTTGAVVPDQEDDIAMTTIESRPIGTKKLPDRQRLLYIGKWALRMPQHTKAHLPRRESLPAACFRLPERAVDYGIVRVTTRL